MKEIMKKITEVSRIVHIEYNRSSGWHCEIYLNDYHEVFADKGENLHALLTSLHEEIMSFLNEQITQA
jgi:hypothetical protein